MYSNIYHNNNIYYYISLLYIYYPRCMNHLKSPKNTCCKHTVWRLLVIINTPFIIIIIVIIFIEMWLVIDYNKTHVLERAIFQNRRAASIIIFHVRKKKTTTDNYYGLGSRPNYYYRSDVSLRMCILCSFAVVHALTIKNRNIQ